MEALSGQVYGAQMEDLNTISKRRYVTLKEAAHYICRTVTILNPLQNLNLKQNKAVVQIELTDWKTLVNTMVCNYLGFQRASERPNEFGLSEES